MHVRENVCILVVRRSRSCNRCQSDQSIVSMLKQATCLSSTCTNTCFHTTISAQQKRGHGPSECASGSQPQMIPSVSPYCSSPLSTAHMKFQMLITDEAMRDARVHHHDSTISRSNVRRLPSKPLSGTGGATVSFPSPTHTHIELHTNTQVLL